LALCHGQKSRRLSEFQPLWTTLEAEGLTTAMGKRIVSVCFYPWAALSVLCDGRAVTCSVDYNGVQRVGDLNFQSVMEIWNGPVLSAIRSKFGKLDYSGFPTCLSCDWVRRR
jgi:hypothetical protein